MLQRCEEWVELSLVYVVPETYVLEASQVPPTYIFFPMSHANCCSRDSKHDCCPSSPLAGTFSAYLTD